MKRRMLRVLSACVLALLLAGGLSTAMAAAKTVPVEIDQILYPGGNLGMLYFPTIPSGSKLISYKSSNTKVLKLSVVKDEIAAQPLKVGKSTVTIKYKYKGKSYSVKAVVKVEKYPNPIKSLKVNGSAVKLSKYKSEYTVKKYKKTSAKISVKPSSGWTITDMTAFIGDDYDWVESGVSFKIPKKKNAEVIIMMQNKKGKSFFYVINLKR